MQKMTCTSFYIQLHMLSTTRKPSVKVTPTTLAAFFLM